MDSKVYIIGAIVLLLLISGGVSYCSYKRFVSKTAKIDKLLSERKYEKAREIANHFDQEEKSIYLTKITSTQITMMMEDGDYESASALARELKMEDVFYDAFFKNIRQIIKRNRYDFVFETLMDWQCPAEAKTYEQDLQKNLDRILEEREPNKDYKGEYYDGDPGNYNWFIRTVNNTVDIVLQKVMFEGNPNNIRRCLMCYKPYLVLDRKVKTNEFCGNEKNEEHRYYKFYFKMQNTAKEDAEKMLREAKIEY